jgi:hypothetical protein
LLEKMVLWNVKISKSKNIRLAADFE